MGIRELIAGARRGVDLVQVHTNFEIGRRIGRPSSAIAASILVVLGGEAGDYA